MSKEKEFNPWKFIKINALRHALEQAREKGEMNPDCYRRMKALLDKEFSRLKKNPDDKVGIDYQI